MKKFHQIVFAILILGIISSCEKESDSTVDNDNSNQSESNIRIEKLIIAGESEFSISYKNGLIDEETLIVPSTHKLSSRIYDDNGKLTELNISGLEGSQTQTTFEYFNSLDSIVVSNFEIDNGQKSLTGKRVFIGEEDYPSKSYRLDLIDADTTIYFWENDNMVRQEIKGVNSYKSATEFEFSTALNPLKGIDIFGALSYDLVEEGAVMISGSKNVWIKTTDFNYDPVSGFVPTGSGEESYEVVNGIATKRFYASGEIMWEVIVSE